MDLLNITYSWILTFYGFIETELIHKILHVLETPKGNRTEHIQSLLGLLFILLVIIAASALTCFPGGGETSI